MRAGAGKASARAGVMSRRIGYAIHTSEDHAGYGRGGAKRVAGLKAGCSSAEPVSEKPRGLPYHLITQQRSRYGRGNINTSAKANLSFKQAYTPHYHSGAHCHCGWHGSPAIRGWDAALDGAANEALAGHASRSRLE